MPLRLYCHIIGASAQYSYDSSPALETFFVNVAKVFGCYVIANDVLLEYVAEIFYSFHVVVELILSH